MTHSYFKSIIILGIMTFSFACNKKEKTDLSQETVIPKPVSVVASGSTYSITEKTGIYYQSDKEELGRTGQFLADIINPSTGFNIQAMNQFLGMKDMN